MHGDPARSAMRGAPNSPLISGSQRSRQLAWQARPGTDRRKPGLAMHGTVLLACLKKKGLCRPWSAFVCLRRGDRALATRPCNNYIESPLFTSSSSFSKCEKDRHVFLSFFIFLLNLLHVLIFQKSEEARCPFLSFLKRISRH